MIMNPFYQWMMFPKFNPLNEKPPTIYALLNSIVNFDNPTPVKIKDLAREGRSTFFDFDYPLSATMTKEEFEIMILNHYMQRRIGFETFTAFQLQLNVKLNEIMPLYNKLLDSLNGWDLFKDGEVTTRKTDATNNVDTTSNSESDRRYSDTPQNRIDDVKNGEYVTDYNFDTNKDTANSKGNATSNETVTKTQHDKINIYKQFIEDRKHIMGMIFKELDCLFYGLV